MTRCLSKPYSRLLVKYLHVSKRLSDWLVRVSNRTFAENDVIYANVQASKRHFDVIFGKIFRTEDRKKCFLL